MNEPPKEIPLPYLYAGEIEIVFGERVAGEADHVEAIEREINAELDKIVDLLHAIGDFDQALSRLRAYKKATDNTDSPRFEWLKPELRRADREQREARARVSKLEKEAKEHLSRITVLRRVRAILRGEETRSPI